MNKKVPTLETYLFLELISGKQSNKTEYKFYVCTI